MKFTAKIIFILFSIFFLLIIKVCGQEPFAKHGNIWVLGSSQDESSVLDFNYDPPLVYSIPVEMDFDGFFTNLCDRDGELLFYTNNCFISNSGGDVVINGDSLNPGFSQVLFCATGGDRSIESGVPLPSAYSDSMFYYFSSNTDTIDNKLLTSKVFFHKIIKNDFNDLEVLSKNQLVFQDTLARGNIEAVLHDNGKDWWILAPKHESNCYHKALLNEDGVSNLGTTCMGIPWNDKEGSQAVFSPNGKYFARVNYQNGLHLYSFDNIEGEFTNEEYFDFNGHPEFPLYTGVSFSSDSKLLYVSTKIKLLQFNLIEDPKLLKEVIVSEWDGFEDPNPTYFNFHALAPNGKIYIGTSFNSSKWLHVINYPNCEGINCNVIQHSLELPKSKVVSLPNLPTFFAPINSEINCDTVVNVSTIDQVFPEALVSPNPFGETFNISLNEEVELKVADSYGRIIFNEIRMEDVQISTTNWPSGLYFLNIQNENSRIKTYKLIKL